MTAGGIHSPHLAARTEDLECCAHAAGLVALAPDGVIVAEMEEVVGSGLKGIGKETDPSKTEFGKVRVVQGLEDEDRCHPSLELGVGTERSIGGSLTEQRD